MPGSRGRRWIIGSVITALLIGILALIVWKRSHPEPWYHDREIVDRVTPSLSEADALESQIDAFCGNCHARAVCTGELSAGRVARHGTAWLRVLRPIGHDPSRSASHSGHGRLFPVSGTRRACFSGGSGSDHALACEVHRRKMGPTRSTPSWRRRSHTCVGHGWSRTACPCCLPVTCTTET